LIRDDPGAVGVWGRVLDEFLDRGADRRLRHYAACHAGHRWKPRLALVLPADFSLRRPSHVRDLSASLEVLASVIDHYHIEVVSDSPDAARLFRRVSPFSREAIARTRGALVLLSRSLNDQVGAVRPSRFVAADPCADRAVQRRIVFTAAGIEVSSRPADDQELLHTLGAGASVLIDEDDRVESFMDALRRLRGAGLSMRLTLSSRADEEFTLRMRTALRDAGATEYREPGSGLFTDRAEIHISNEPVALLTQAASATPRYQFRWGRFWVVDREPSRRSDYYLLRGEESDADRLLDIWLVRGMPDGRKASRPQLARSLEPLVSIVVPVHQETTEILRLAHSIYEQDYPWLEIIWVSSGCSSETMEAIRASENYLMKRRYQVRVIELAGGLDSAGPAQDFGIRAASGELACLLDPADWLAPGFFAFLRHGPWRDDTLYHPTRVEHDSGRAAGGDSCRDRAIGEEGPLEPDDSVSPLRMCESRGNSGVVFARSLFARAAGLGDHLQAGGILDLWRLGARAGARDEHHPGCVHISL
jgi:hypothetical protein